MKVIDLLAQIPLFQGLPPEQLQEVAQIVVERTFPKQQLIFQEGDEGKGFYIVLQGKIKVFKLAPDGREQILHIFGPGEPFAEVPVFAGQQYPASAMTLEDSKLLFVPRTAFLDLIRRNPALALGMLAILARRLRQLAALVEDLALKEVPMRLAAYLLYQSEEQQGASELSLEIAKGQLANLLGTSPETLSRALRRLANDKLIASSGARIKILNRRGLQEVALGLRR